MNDSIPDTAICFFKDGASWCCVFGNFINLMESNIGFGETMFQAMDKLMEEVNEQLNRPPQTA